MLGVFQILTKTMRLLEQQHSDGEGVSLLGVRFLRRFHNLDRQQAYHFEKLTSAFSDPTGVCFARRWHHLKGISIKSLLINSTFFITMEICFHFILFPISTKLSEKTDVNQIVFISSYLKHLITILCLSLFQSRVYPIRISWLEDFWGDYMGFTLYLANRGELVSILWTS